MKYILTDKEVEHVSKAYKIKQEVVHQLVYKINNYHAHVECSLYGELDHILFNDDVKYKQLKAAYRNRP